MRGRGWYCGDKEWKEHVLRLYAPSGSKVTTEKEGMDQELLT